MASGGNTLSKAERLSGKKSIATLLADGKWGSYGHFRYCWLEQPAAAGGGDVLPAAKSNGQVRVPQGEPCTCIAFPQSQAQGSTPPALPIASGKGPGSVPQGEPCPGIALPDEPTQTSDRPGRILISVPKRYFKRAVKRNLLKRRIREVYRVQKVAGVDILFQYASAELADFEAIKADVAAILARICDGLTDACRKTPENLPEQPEKASAGRYTPENLSES